MSTENKPTNETILGKLIDHTKLRDAIHIAVAPVKAMQMLKPGQHIGFVDDTQTNVGYFSAILPRTINFIGIVDPFLTEPVKENEWFYMLLYPKTITGLKHVWTHPAFDVANEPYYNKVDKSLSEQWLRNYVSVYRGDYDEVIQAIKEKGDVCFFKDLDYEDFSDYNSEFWRHVENVLGYKLTNEHKEKVSFGCAC